MTEAANEPRTFDDAVTGEERTARAPFAGVDVRDLVRDGISVTALLVALGLPWAFSEPGVSPLSYFHSAGASRLEVVLTTVVALAALVLPYARRAGVVTGAWAADEKRVRLVGLTPLVLVALVHVVLEVIPGDSWGIGAGLGLALAGALLAAGATAVLTWSRTLWVVGGIVALLAVVSPILAATNEDVSLSVWGIVAAVLTALLALGFLWLTVWQFENGDHAAGVLLLGVGIAVALGMALLGANPTAPWTETVHLGWVGIVLWPALAAAATRRVVERRAADGDQPRLWSATAAHALLLAVGLGAFVALVALLTILDRPENGFDAAPTILRLVFGLIIAVVAFLGRRALVQDLHAGHTPAVGAAVVTAVLGLVLVIVRAGASTRVDPLDFLLTFGVPAIVLGVLLVPRSLRTLRAELAAAAPAPASDDEGAPEDEDPALVVPERTTSPADRAPVSPTPVVNPPVRTLGHRAQAAGAPTVEVSPQEVAARAGAEAAATSENVRDAAPESTSTSQVASESSSQVVAEPATEASAQETAVFAPVTEAPATPGPFGNVGATQVLPAIADEPGSRWTAAHAVDPATPLADLAQIVQEAPHLRPLVASNPSTYPALLDWLGALGDPAIDAALRARR